MKWIKVLIVGCLLFLAGVANATTYTVCESGCDTTTISSAVRGLCSNSDTVYVYNGTYLDTTECEKAYLSNLTIRGESEAGVIYRWNITTAGASSLDKGYFVWTQPDSSGLSTQTLMDMTWRFVGDTMSYVRFDKYCDVVLNNMTFVDSTTVLRGAYSYMFQSSNVTITDCNFSSITSGHYFQIEADSTRSLGSTFDVDDCNYDGLRIWFSSSGDVPTATFDDCVLYNSALYNYSIYNKLSVSGCTITIIDDAATARGIYMYDNSNVNAGRLYSYNNTFLGLSPYSGGSYTSEGIRRASDDTVLPDSIISCTFNYVDSPILLGDDDAADNGENGGSDSYINDITATNVTGYGVFLTYNNTLIDSSSFQSNEVSTTHMIITGPDGPEAQGYDKAHNITVSNTTLTGGEFGLVDKGNSNQFDHLTITGAIDGLYLKGSDSAYVAQCDISNCSRAVRMGFAQGDTLDAVTMVTVKNLKIDDCGRGLLINQDSSVVNPVQIDYNAYLSCDTLAYQGWDNTVLTLATLRTFVPDSSAAGDDCDVRFAAHSTDEEYWQQLYGGDTTCVKTPIENWLSMGITQQLDFPNYPDHFRRLEHADSLVTLYPNTWQYNDILEVHEFDEGQWQYMYERYLAGTDTLYLNKGYRANKSSTLRIP